MRKKPAPATKYQGPTCGACAHWVRMDCDTDAVGECYLSPPMVQVDDDGYMLVRPILEGNERACGQFKGNQ